MAVASEQQTIERSTRNARHERRPWMETTMFRKVALALAAAGSLGIAAFAPSSASAHDGGPHFNRGHHGFGVHRGWHDSRAHFRHHHFRHHGCIQQRLVKTPWGFRYRPVNVCRY
jgi:hypothetical protein